MRRFLLACLFPLLAGCNGPEIILTGPADHERSRERNGVEQYRSPFTETGEQRPGGSIRHATIVEPGIHRVTWQVSNFDPKACNVHIYIVPEGGGGSRDRGWLVGSVPSLKGGAEREGEARTPGLSPGPHVVTVRGNCSVWTVKLRPD